jgi:hypothetical protein
MAIHTSEATVQAAAAHRAAAEAAGLRCDPADHDFLPCGPREIKGKGSMVSRLVTGEWIVK